MEYSHSSDEARDAAAMMRKKRSKKKRFSDKQIQSMESMFETESWLQPLKKLQLATEQLGCYIYGFRTKELDGSQSSLRETTTRFDALILKKEHQALLIQA
ncbi:Homeobox-like domain superfamily [Sesbania bispinosa]|nr:Homeobox-like domain superfamily [Sesbania bispinosa]